MTGSPQQLRPNVINLTREESTRIDRFAARFPSSKVAALALGIGVATLEAARDEGRMQGKTRDRILKAIEAAG